jgi:hypothetical protein
VLTVEVANDLRADQPAPATDSADRADRADRADGADGADNGGHGLLNMRARADAVGGTLSAGPVGTGWLVRAELPVADGYARASACWSPTITAPTAPARDGVLAATSDEPPACAEWA